MAAQAAVRDIRDCHEGLRAILWKMESGDTSPPTAARIITIEADDEGYHVYPVVNGSPTPQTTDDRLSEGVADPETHIRSFGSQRLKKKRS